MTAADVRLAAGIVLGAVGLVWLPAHALGARPAPPVRPVSVSPAESWRPGPTAFASFTFARRRAWGTARVRFTLAPLRGAPRTGTTYTLTPGDGMQPWPVVVPLVVPPVLQRDPVRVCALVVDARYRRTPAVCGVLPGDR